MAAPSMASWRSRYRRTISLRLTGLAYVLRSLLPAGDLWASSQLLIEIRIGLNEQWVSLITGLADGVSIDPIAGEVSVAGRDLTSLFVGAQIEESFENQTSSDIATLLAARQGLAASVAPTGTLIGRYYQNGRTRTTLPQHARATTQWELLCWLAQLENFDVWVDGRTLNFQPLDQREPSFVISPRDCLRLNLHRAMDLAAGITVTVKSWDSLSQTAIVQSASNADDVQACGDQVGHTPEFVVRRRADVGGTAAWPDIRA